MILILQFGIFLLSLLFGIGFLFYWLNYIKISKGKKNTSFESDLDYFEATFDKKIKEEAFNFYRKMYLNKGLSFSGYKDYLLNNPRESAFKWFNEFLNTKCNHLGVESLVIKKTDVGIRKSDLYLDSVLLTKKEQEEMIADGGLSLPKIYNDYFNEIKLFNKELSFSEYIKVYERIDVNFLKTLFNKKSIKFNSGERRGTIFYLLNDLVWKVSIYIDPSDRTVRKFKVDDVDFGKVEYFLNGKHIISETLDEFEDGIFMTKEELELSKKRKELSAARKNKKIS